MDAKSLKLQTNIMSEMAGDVTLKRVASTEGGEWAGPCPFCGGTDRFRVQPYCHNGGRWFCRGCGDNRWHDIFDYIQKRDGVDFLEAITKASGGKHLQKSTTETPPESSGSSSEFIDRVQWMNTAYEFLEACIKPLWSPEGEQARDYLHWRGLKDSTIKHWMLGYHPGEAFFNSSEWGLADERGRMWLPGGILIPCQDETGLHYLKIRQSKNDPKYLMVKGSQNWLFGAQTFVSHKFTTQDFIGANPLIAFLFEGEFDVMLAWQTDYVLGYGSMPAGQKLKVEWKSFFHDLEDLIIAFDDDMEGKKAAEKLCQLSSSFHKARPFPFGKDLTEYHQQGGDVLEWICDEMERLR